THGYIAMGSVFAKPDTFSAKKSQATLTYTNPSGRVIWNRSYHAGDSTLTGLYACQTADNNIVTVAGLAHPDADTYSELCLMLTDRNGNILRRRVLGLMDTAEVGRKSLIPASL